MTITQYSRIQHRRGILADLPAVLNTSELGHVVDLQRLFIGNGQLADGAPIVGNTEIITDYTLLTNPTALQWVYRSNTPVRAQTGVDANHPIVRSVGQKLDDMVNVRDFGALGNGIADDTDAINRALQQLYTVAIPGPFALQMSYRALYFPAGVYNISDYIYLPPYATLIGDGSMKSVIKQITPSKLAVTRTADSLFQNYSNGIGTGGATLPTNIYAEGITFQHIADMNVINLELASNVLFKNCGVMGANTGTLTSSIAIQLENNIGAVTNAPVNIKFDTCQFSFVSYVVNTSITHGRFSNEIYFDSCDFDKCVWGICVNTDFQDVKVSNSLFSDISNSAIYSAANVTPPTVQNGLVSINNTYVACGAVGIPVINFVPGALNCHSLGDIFIDSNGPNVSDVGQTTFELSTVNAVNINNITDSAKQGPISLPGSATNQPTGITLDLSINNSAFIDYTVLISGGVRAGRITIVSDGTNIAFYDSGSLADTGPTGVSFSAGALSGTILPINYTSTSANTASWNIQTKLWLS